MAFWICITDEENLDIISQNKLWGVSKFYRNSLSQVRSGDKIIFYIKGLLLFLGVYESTSELYSNNERIFKPIPFTNENFPYRISIELISQRVYQVSIKKVLDKLSFIENKEKWGIKMRRAMLEISEKDFRVIRKAMYENSA